jgi:hypothetical protein
MDDRRVEVFSPGRICLFGEHSDWAAEYGIHPGHCIVVGTDQCIKALVRPYEGFRVESLIPDATGRPSGRTRQMACPWTEEALLAAACDQDEFFRYWADKTKTWYAGPSSMSNPGGQRIWAGSCPRPRRSSMRPLPFTRPDS